MENNITVNMENLSEDERNVLLGLIKKANKPKSKVWEPEYGKSYWVYFSDGTVGDRIWIESEEDISSYSIGNCFKTKEDAEFAIEKLKVIAELKRFAEENNEYEIDWGKDQQSKYLIYFDHHRHILDVTKWYTNQYSNVTYFSSEKIAKQAIDKIGKDRLKKYYFEVED